MEEMNQQKVYWCKCLHNPDLLNEIKRGSVPKDTGKICSECGGRIFEDEKER